MYGSVIHTAFDPLPSLAFGLISIGLGLVIEIKAAITDKYRPARAAGAERTCVSRIGNLKHRFPLLAVAFLLVATGAGSATIGRDHDAAVGDGKERVSVASTATAGSAPRVTCFNGMTSGRETLYRGWFCVPDGDAPRTN